MNELDILADLPLEADTTAAVTGGALLTGNVLSPLTLGVGQIAHLDFGNGPIIGGHANVDL